MPVIPVRPRPRPPQIGSPVHGKGPQEGRLLVVDVYRGLESIERGTVRALRLVGVPAKTHPRMNSRTDRPREIRARNRPTNGENAIHQAQ